MNKKKQIIKLSSKETVTVGKFKHVDVDSELKEKCEREAFYLLGKLSTQFAELEELVQEFICFLVLNENVVGQYLLEKNTLDSNLKLLEKLNEYYEFQPEIIHATIQEIYTIKQIRNNLIHGTWFIHPDNFKEKIIINVRSCKIEVISDLAKKHKSWTNITEKNYNILEVEEFIKIVTSINHRITLLKSSLVSWKENEED